MSATATYLYAITRPLDSKALAAVTGVGEAAVRVISHGPIAALVSTVDLAEFGEEPLARHLEDLAWLGQTARQHDEVVHAASNVVTTMPLRLATICLDDDAVRARLDAVMPVATAFLDHVTDSDEWGVKLFAQPTSEPVQEPDADRPTTGTAYLLRRREQLSGRQTLADRAAKDADDVFARLSELAVDARRHRPQDARLTGDPRPMILNAAFLVDESEEAHFRAEVARLGQECTADALVLTGPWPPYSFVPQVAP